MLRPYLLYPVWASCLALLMGQALIPSTLARVQYVPLLVSLVVFGLPHGAVDHLIPFQLNRRKPRLGGVLAISALYLAVALAYLGMWVALPLLALAFFLFLSILHWGQGDSFFLLAFLGRPPPTTRSGLALIWGVRGCLPILLPPLARPDDFAMVSQGILHQYGWNGTLNLSPAARAIGVALLAMLVLAYVRQALAADRECPYPVGSDLFEIGLLCVLACTIPPVLAVGVYFCLWHSWRHIARLLLAKEANQTRLARRRFGAPLRGFALDAAPTTLAALGLLAALYWLHRDSVHSVESLIYLYLSLIAALTLPHTLLVLWMDSKQSALWGEGRSYYSDT